MLQNSNVIFDLSIVGLHFKPCDCCV